MSIKSVREGSSPASWKELRHWAECLEMSCPSSVHGGESPPKRLAAQLISVQRNLGNVCPHGSRAVPRSGQILTAPQTAQEPRPRFGRGSRQHSLSSLCTEDTPSQSCPFICKLSSCTGRDLANMGLHNAVCTESHIRAGAR